MKAYQQEHNFNEIPQFLYEKSEEGIWTCAFCGTRNQASASKCRLCSTLLAYSEYCTKDKLEQFFVEHKAQQEQIAEEQRKRQAQIAEEERIRLEEEARIRDEQQEKARIERKEQERIWEIKAKRRSTRLSIIMLIVAVILVLSGLLWHFVWKPMNEYRVADEYFQAGKYYQAYEDFDALGNYKDAKYKALDSYAAYIGTIPVDYFAIDMYRWLLDSGYPQEKVFATLVSVLDQTSDFDVLLKGYQWLLRNGYPQESLYELAGGMVEKGRFFEGYKFYRLLEDFKDSQAKAASLADRKSVV